MNLYIRTMNDVIEYIEQNMSERLTLGEMSRRFHISEFHFSRLFKMLAGISIKQYILGRKLAEAADRLKNTAASVTDIALDFGYEYTEVFSRAFKKQYGVSPATYRRGRYSLDITPKAQIIERDIINLCGGLILREEYIYLNSFDLYGRSFEVDGNSPDFGDTLKNAGTSTLMDFTDSGGFFSVVNCHGDESGRYTVFFGKEKSGKGRMQTRNIPAGWYARFMYHGNMLDMRTTFNDDFYRWMLVKEIKPAQNGIGMINIYDGNGLRDVKIIVPVSEPR